MSVDGTWNLMMQTPMGERASSVTFKSAGGTLSGTQTAEGEVADVVEGTVNGASVAWKVAITNPMPLSLEFRGTVDGDAISGDMDISGFGNWPFSGKRA